MKLNAEQKQLLLLATLKVLDANQTKFALGLDAITLKVGGQYGFEGIERTEVEVELDGLIGRGLAEEAHNKLNPQQRLFKISAEGRALLSAGTNQSHE